MFKKIFLLWIIVVWVQVLLAQSLHAVAQGPNCSIRGLSVVDNRIAWLSGSNGHIAITTNGGKTWKWQQVKGFEQIDFRDVEAFSEKQAIIMSSGTPALILKTEDGGASWQTKYQQNQKAYFLDGMAFADSRHGYALGDPIDGKFLLLETKDNGETWSQMPDPPLALTGEAAFAASGTCISTNGKFLNIVTGGSSSRLLGRAIADQQTTFNWNAVNLPLLQGKDSQGAFSSVAYGKQQLVVGGDYQNKQRSDSVMCMVVSAAVVEKEFPVKQPLGFQSCIEFVKGGTFIATGTSGTNITTDNGKTWKRIDTNSYNVCQKAKRGSLVLLAGDQGKIAIYKN